MGECLIIRSGGGIDTSNANATTNVIVTGYSCYVDGELVSGDIPVVTHTYPILQPHDFIDLKYGYYTKDNNISTSTLSEETKASGVSSDLLTGHVGWANGIQLTGAMVNHGSISQQLTPNGTYVIPSGWYATNSNITQSLETCGAVNVTPTTIDQVVCLANRWTLGDIVVIGNSNLIAGNIKNGVEIYGVIGNFVGWVDSSWVAANHNSGRQTIANASWNTFDITYSGAAFDNLKKSFSWATVWGWAFARASNGGCEAYVRCTPGGSVATASSYANERYDVTNSGSQRIAIGSTSSLHVWCGIGATWGLAPRGQVETSCTVTFSK